MPAADTAELTRTVALSAAALQGAVKSPAEFKLTRVEQVCVKGKYVWRATYKPLELLPPDPSTAEIGAGGEVFINVDLKTGQTEVRHGE